MNGLKSKILLLTLVPVSIILFTICGITIYNKYITEKQLLMSRLNSYQQLLESGQLTLDTSTDKSKLKSLLQEKVEFAEILSSNHSVLYSSEDLSSPLLQKQDEEEVKEARSEEHTSEL